MLKEYRMPFSDAISRALYEITRSAKHVCLCMSVYAYVCVCVIALMFVSHILMSEFYRRLDAADC